MLFLFMLEVLILSIKNNIKKVVDGKCEKHYHEIQRSLSCGICDYLYLIPTIRTSISGNYLDVEFDIFLFYIYISFKIVDTDESGCV